jgi:hypothetical protein
MTAEFMTVTVVVAEHNPLAALCGSALVAPPTTRARTIRTADVAGFESVPSFEHAGQPHTLVRLYSGEQIFVKEHESTIAANLSGNP